MCMFDTLAYIYIANKWFKLISFSTQLKNKTNLKQLISPFRAPKYHILKSSSLNSFDSISLKIMTSLTFGHRSNWSPGIGIQDHQRRGKIHRVSYSDYCSPLLPSGEIIIHNGNHVAANSRRRSGRLIRPVFAGSGDGDTDPDESDRGINDGDNAKGENGGMNFETLRENLERSVGNDDSRFSGIDLATLIRNKYGKSYDVQLIKKEFMGRNLLALNVMWKFREQKSFPLSEEEYLLRLDGVANTLKCWGAVAHIRNSLDKTKDRPRIGKAVSIFIDMDESGGRANEWIYK